MSPRDWSGAMPNGEVTDDPDTYVRAWQSLAQAVEELMPSHRVMGYDPGISFTVGQYGSESVSVGLAMAIRDMLADNKRLRDNRK